MKVNHIRIWIAQNRGNRQIVSFFIGIGISKISDELEKSLISYEHQVKNIEKLMSQKTPQIYCDKPKTALLVEIGKYGSIWLGISLFLSVFWIGLVILKTNETEFRHLENLSKYVKFDKKSGQYFIEKHDYNKNESGIILKNK